MTVDVYPVGLLADLQQFGRGMRRPQMLRHVQPTPVQRLRYALGYPLRQARAGNWRAVKNYANGYLAEPAEFPPGVTRCGSGWTRRRARRDWERRVKAGM